MSISFSCMECGKLYRVDERLAGKTASCKACKKPMQIPKLEAASSDAAANDGLMIDWSAIAQTKEESLAKAVNISISAERKRGIDFGNTNPYRVARIIFGTLFVTAALALAVVIWKQSTMDAPADGALRRIAWRFTAFGIACALLVAGGKMIINPTTREEHNAPFLSSISKPVRWGYPLLCVAFLVVLLAGSPIAIDLSALALVIVGGGTVGRGIGKLFGEEKKRHESYSIRALDHLIIGLIPLLFAAPYWVWKVNKVLSEP